MTQQTNQSLKNRTNYLKLLKDQLHSDDSLSIEEIQKLAKVTSLAGGILTQKTLDLPGINESNENSQGILNAENSKNEACSENINLEDPNYDPELEYKIINDFQLNKGEFNKSKEVYCEGELASECAKHDKLLSEIAEFSVKAESVQPKVQEFSPKSYEQSDTEEGEEDFGFKYLENNLRRHKLEIDKIEKEK